MDVFVCSLRALRSRTHDVPSAARSPDALELVDKLGVVELRSKLDIEVDAIENHIVERSVVGFASEEHVPHGLRKAFGLLL